MHDRFGLMSAAEGRAIRTKLGRDGNLNKIGKGWQFDQNWEGMEIWIKLGRDGNLNSCREGSQVWRVILKKVGRVIWTSWREGNLKNVGRVIWMMLDTFPKAFPKVISQVVTFHLCKFLAGKSQFCPSRSTLSPSQF